MSLIIALVVAALILLFWRQVLILIAWAVIALILLGIISVLHVTEQTAPIPASTSISQGCTQLH